MPIPTHRHAAEALFAGTEMEPDQNFRSWSALPENPGSQPLRRVIEPNDSYPAVAFVPPRG